LFGDGKWDGWETVYMTPKGYCMPVCTPGYLPNGTLDDARELAAYSWICSPHFRSIWQHWCQAVGQPALQPRSWFEVDNGLTAREAARNGMGLWMAGGQSFRQPDAYVARGELVLAHSYHALMFEVGFYLAWRPQAMHNPAAVAMRDWASRAMAMHQGSGICSRPAAAPSGTPL
jgi:DNA-binding transcriptional LysR family regulator